MKMHLSEDSDYIPVEMQWDTQDSTTVEPTEDDSSQDLDKLGIDKEKEATSNNIEAEGQDAAWENPVSLADTAIDHRDKIAREIIKIDPEGDVALRVESKDLIVSSKILSMTSPVFDEMMSKDDTETTGLGALLVLRLQGDDPGALTLLCQLLHYRSDAVKSQPNLDLLLEFINLANKYKCIPAVQLQACHWLRCEARSPLLTPEKTKKKWRAAFLLGDEEECRKIMESLTADELEEKLIDLDLPAKQIVETLSLRRRNFGRYLAAVEKAIYYVQQESERPKWSNPKICSSCRMHKPRETRVCGSCRGRQFEEFDCTSASQLAAFMKILVSCGVWPLNERINEATAKINGKLKNGTDELYRQGKPMHDCDYGTNCVVHTALSLLIMDLRTIQGA
ncbi:hypothetical protein DTO282E5_4921 [Paecilomyces variotii]|nr:hypothetical protein DTO282E5_4921 [Paecilomyces variotii]